MDQIKKENCKKVIVKMPARNYTIMRITKKLIIYMLHSLLKFKHRFFYLPFEKFKQKLVLQNSSYAFFLLIFTNRFVELNCLT